MDFELSDDQLALRAAARDLLAARATSTQVRAVVDAGAGWDAELWKAMVVQGWTGVAVSADSGGLGLGWVEAAVLAEEVGAHVAPAPFVPQVLALAALADDSTWCDRLLDGSSVACVAWSGGREVAPYAPSADVVVGVVDGQLVLAELTETRPERQPAMDVTREVGWLDVAALSTHELGGPDAVERFCDLGAMLYAAELLGASNRMLDLTVEYAKERMQFGRPIGSFQAVKHRCADMLVDVEGMRSAVYYAAWCLSADHPDASVAASTAKVWCTDAGQRVMASALQVHGGIGFTWEHDVHLYVKRAQLDGLCFGDAAHHRARLARLLRTRIEAGDSVV